MKKQFRKLSLAVIFAMAVSMIAPAAHVAEAATTKTFTYAEQQTGDTVITLVMNKGEKAQVGTLSDAELKFALFGDGRISDEMLDEVKRFAEFIKARDAGNS